MIFSTRYWGLVPFTVLASETVRFAILDMDTNFQSLSISNLVPRIRKKRSHETIGNRCESFGLLQTGTLKIRQMLAIFFFRS